MLEQTDAHKIFGGQQLQYRHDSQALSCDMQFSIYLPPQADQSKVPVLYWLSGLTCTDQNFVIKAGAQRYAAELGVAIVCPDTSPRGEDVLDDPHGAYDLGFGAGFYLNATQEPWAKHYRMYDYVVAELPQIINAQFPVEPSRASIFGHSMGGHGALTIALKNPDSFRSVSALAPIVSPMNCSLGQKALKAYLGDNRSEWEQYDTCALLNKAKQQLPTLVDQGDADEFLGQLNTELLIQTAERTGYMMDIRYQSGYDHSYFFIATFIEDHLNFHARYLKA